MQRAEERSVTEFIFEQRPGETEGTLKSPPERTVRAKALRQDKICYVWRAL